MMIDINSSLEAAVILVGIGALLGGIGAFLVGLSRLIIAGLKDSEAKK